MMFSRLISSLALVLLSLGVAQGFAPRVSTPRTVVAPTSPSNTQLHVDATGWDSFRKVKDIAYGEESRQYRRTVYSHDDWKKHRSPDRFSYYLIAIFKSGVYKNLTREVLATTVIATLIFGYNMLVGGYTDLAGVEQAAVLPDVLPKFGMPMTPFTLASPSLGLLLVFRTNTSYQRWDEARKNWGMNINHTRDLVRMANTYYDSTGVSEEERTQDLAHTALCTWAFVRAMKRHLSPEEEDERAFQIELYQKLPQLQADRIIAAAHRPNRALQDLSYAIDNLPMHFIRKNEIQKAVTIFEDNLGSSERLLTSPVPVFYTRHLARFLSVWLLLLPFALYDAFGSTWNHIGMIPATAVLSVFLFGIEELATQLEEPFTILPMQAFCDKIYNWCTEIMTWSPGDNGMPVRPVKPEHAYFMSGPTTSTINGSYQEAAYESLPPSTYEAAPEPTYVEPEPQQQPSGSASYQQDVPMQQLSFDEFLKRQGQGK